MAGFGYDLKDGSRIPAWLAVIVVVLLLGVVASAGYIINDLLSPSAQPTAIDKEIARKEEAVERAPDDIESLLALGHAYQRAGRFREALRLYDQVLNLRPQDTAALYNKGIVLLEQGNHRQAEVTLWDVLERDREHALAAKALGELYIEQGEYRSLLYTLRPVVEENEASADLQYLMGLAYENLGKGDLAEERYRLAIKYFPDMPEAREALDRLGVVIE